MTTHPIDAELVDRIRAARRAIGLTQSEVRERLAELGVDLGKSAFAKLERGERGITFAEAIALTRVLRIDINDLTASGDAATVDSIRNHRINEAAAMASDAARTITAVADRLQRLTETEPPA